MPTWNVASVDIEPSIRLQDWRIMETDKGERHFVGWAGEGRVSSRIETFDVQTRRGVTRSGRIYELIGESRYDSQADYVWAVWCRRNAVDSFRDVSADALPRGRTRTPRA